MKTIKFTTIAQKSYEIQFNEDAFFDYMWRCGRANLEIENQVSLYLNNLHESLLDAFVPYNSVIPQTIDYEFSNEFNKRYNDINDMLKYGM